ncbi:MAG: hypothetical protein U0441_02595 [Polyangiaceae bacterium]
MKARSMMAGAALGLWLAGCNGTVVDARDGEGGGGASATGAGGGTTSSATGGDTIDTFTSPPAECVVQPADPPPALDPTCDILNPLFVSGPVLEDASGDGKLSPGETGTLTVQLQETSGFGMYYYPLVNFTTDVPGVSLTNEAVLYGIAACDSVAMATQITVAPDVPAGETVVIHAQVGALNLDCPKSSSLSVTFQVQP